MTMMLSSLLACSTAHVAPIGARATLHLLPFEPANAMLPGEIMQVGLNEATHEMLLAEVLFSQEHNLVGQLLRRQSDATSGWASSCVPILKIIGKETADDGQIWLQTQCVGRARILKFHEEEERYDSAEVEPLVDLNCAEDGQDTAQAYAIAAGLYANCVDQQMAIDKRKSVAARNRKSHDPREPLDTRSPLLWKRDGTACHPLAGKNPLAATTQHRVAQLCERGMDEAPAESLKDLHSTWCVESDGDLEQQLASFTPFVDASTRERMRALMCESTLERLVFARDCLGRRLKRLRAENAVYAAIAS